MADLHTLQALRALRAAALAGLCVAALAGHARAAGLATALEQALLRHPEAVALEARAAEAEAAGDIAGGLLPEAGAVAIGSRNDRWNRNRGQQEYEVELAAPLWLPGQKSASLAAAQRQAEDVAARHQALRWSLAGELREAWWALAAARSAAGLAQRRLETARALESDVQRRYRAGDLSRIDANLAQAEVLAAEAEQIEAAALRLTAEQALQALTGLPAPEQLAEETATVPEAVTTATTATTGATSVHPLLAAASATARAARARHALALESGRAAPELALRVVRERGDFAEPYSSSVGLRLKIPFSSEARQRRDDAASRAEAVQAEAELQRAGQRLELDAQRARLKLDAASRQLAMAGQRRSLARDNLQLAEKAFALGESDLAALLRIRAAAFDAESLHDRQRVARAAAVSRLNHALGVLP